MREIEFRIDTENEWQEMYIDGILAAGNHTLGVVEIAEVLNYYEISKCEIIKN